MEQQGGVHTRKGWVFEYGKKDLKQIHVGNTLKGRVSELEKVESHTKFDGKVILREGVLFESEKRTPYRRQHTRKTIKGHTRRGAVVTFLRGHAVRVKARETTGATRAEVKNNESADQIWRTRKHGRPQRNATTRSTAGDWLGEAGAPGRHALPYGVRRIFLRLLA